MPIASTGLNVGVTTNDKTAGTTLTVPSLGGTSLTTGDVVVFTVVFDNTGTSTPTVSCAHGGTASITWATQLTANASTATSGGGCRVAIATGVVTAGGTLTSFTATFSASITAKTGHLGGFSGVDNANPVRSGIANTGAGTTANGTVANLGTLVAGDCVIAVHGVENAAGVFTALDTDTLNGSWTTLNLAATAGGGAATNVAVYSAYKVVTAAGTQTFGGTHAANDWSAAILALQPAAATSTSDAARSTTRRLVPLLVR